MVLNDIREFITSFITSFINSPFMLSVVIGAHGLINFYRYAAIVSKDRKTKDWPSVLGTIISSSLKKERRARIGNGNHSELYTLIIPHIKYTYTVNGTIHENSRIGYGDYTRRTDGFSKKLMERFPHGATVPVYYDPANTNESVLEKKSTNSYVMYFSSILFMFTALILLGVWLYQLFT